MKKFSFSLDTVHKFKGQVLNSLLNELAVISAEILKQEKLIRAKENEIKDVNLEFNEKNKMGINIQEMTVYRMYIKRLQRELEFEYKKLEEIELRREEKKQEVIESKKENLSLDILKQNKLDEYNKMVQKNEEIVVEEFVANGLISQKA